MGATPTGATPTGPTLDPLNILVNKFNIATHVALILFLFSSWINYLLYDTKSVMVFWQLLSKLKRFVTIFRISWNGPTLFNIPIGDFPPVTSSEIILQFTADDQSGKKIPRWTYRHILGTTKTSQVLQPNLQNQCLLYEQKTKQILQFAVINRLFYLSEIPGSS